MHSSGDLLQLAPNNLPLSCSIDKHVILGTGATQKIQQLITSKIYTNADGPQPLRFTASPRPIVTPSSTAAGQTNSRPARLHLGGDKGVRLLVKNKPAATSAAGALVLNQVIPSSLVHRQMDQYERPAIPQVSSIKGGGCL